MNAPPARIGWLGLLLAIGGCVGGQDAGGTSPTAVPIASLTTDAPRVSPSPIALRDLGSTAILDPGTYVLDQFPVDIAFDIPDGDPPGWHVGYSRADVATVLWYTPPEITYAFAFWTADNLYVDPCNPTAGELEPPIGPSVDDLVAALSNQGGFRATDPVDVTVGAFRGKEIELTALELAEDCPEVIPWSGADDTAGLATGEALRVQILDVDGVRIVTHAREPARPDAAVEAELHQILDSIRIEPLP
jgi:hypothetical protein